MALLQRRGRVTYRALKLHFTLDDEALEVLKEEIIKAQRLAVDEAGEILVWTGGAEGRAALALPLPQLAPQDIQAAPAEAPSAVSQPRLCAFLPPGAAHPCPHGR